MLKNFRSYHLAIELYAAVKPRKLPGHLKSQLLRAASSIVLNLAEGTARATTNDRRHFFTIARASLKEVEAVLDLEASLNDVRPAVEVLGAHLHNLVKNTV